MLWMAGISHDGEEVFKAGLTADVFGRCAMGTIDKARIGKLRIRRSDGFDSHSMPPVVAKIVSVGELFRLGFNQLAEGGMLGINDVHEAVRVRNAIAGLVAPLVTMGAHVKPEKVIVLEQHHSLDCLMQRVKC